MKTAKDAFSAGGETLEKTRQHGREYCAVYKMLKKGIRTPVNKFDDKEDTDSKKKTQPSAKVFNPLRKGSGNPRPYEGEGELQPLSAMILMSVLYAARIARYDLFKPIQFLAKRELLSGIKDVTSGSIKLCHISEKL